MKTADLNYSYPEELVATAPAPSFRTLVHDTTQILECSKSDLLDRFSPGDVLVINDTRVQKRRVFAKSGEEVLFIKDLGQLQWQVLFPARGMQVGEVLSLPAHVEMQLVEKGLPQTVKLNRALDDDYFESFGELALPPYIQKARGDRHMSADDETWYQTSWAKNSGSAAAPTASLHFSKEDLELLSARGVKVVPITLHVGLGTFLPVKTDRLDEHVMHHEWVEIPPDTALAVNKAKVEGRLIWALGTTVTRALEAWKEGHLALQDDRYFRGETNLFIKPGFEFKVVDRLLTNFHQPQSTLLALVCAFAGYDEVLWAYKLGIGRRMRLFSYGDLTVWYRRL
ncbi:MAG: tRNA preQ1(34) S-adenosylmethionine ribosyltransferase-isomerase QueA [Pseudobdellovibrionaceae bacterium]|nr:tRNA preQ1(34) S-adenosylmethionine ribosyltransferase-isomerase QueA [Bdellovibrionales bacterium]USN48679.1 MAG: tRNA preQ1(34) S-adenosylmethionine ribosyltransferase-isomerase QueA [Pseudobdellovibrionaceae bacterium]